MRWSNDTYVSNPHRVVSPVEQERYSIAYFSDPDSDADIRCLPGCSSAANPPRYAPIAAAEYLRQRFEATYAYRRAAAGARPAAREGISG
jgi:isopenicillin N synthase-like dioxygenase